MIIFGEREEGMEGGRTEGGRKEGGFIIDLTGPGGLTRARKATQISFSFLDGLFDSIIIPFLKKMILLYKKTGSIP